MVFQVRKRRYLVGIVALVLVSVLNLIPPMVMGRVIDAITSGQLTQQALLLDLFYLLLAAFGMYYLRYVWRMYILGTSYRLGQIMRSRLFEHFTKNVACLLSDLSDGGSDGTRNQRYQCLDSSSRWRGYVSGGCLNHSFSDLVDHAL